MDPPGGWGGVGWETTVRSAEKIRESSGSAGRRRADVMQLLTGGRSLYWTPAYALLLVCLLFWTSYRLIARIFKWLTLALFAYIVAAFLAHPDWSAVVRATLIPHEIGRAHV